MLYKEKIINRKIFILIIDVVILCFSLLLAGLVRRFGEFDWQVFQSELKSFSVLFFFCLIIFYLFELYDLRKARNYYWVIYALAFSMAVNIIVGIIYFYLLNFFIHGITPITILIIWAFLSYFLLCIWRYLIYKYYTNKRFFRRVAILGANELGEELANEVLNVHGIDYKIVGFISTEDDEFRSPISKLPLLGNYKVLNRLIREHNLDILVVAFDYRQKKEVIQQLSDSLSDSVKVLDFPIFYEQINYKVPTERIDHFWFLYNVDLREKWVFEKTKRIFDLMFSLFGLLFVIVIFPFVALAIKLDSKGSVFYKQKRVGKGGKKFILYKFRTMKKNAEKDGAVWATENDSRVTRLGRFLRKSRIDELPQFYNIIKGDMSLVGPRPERPEFVKILNKEIPFYYKRHIVRPGATGWAQVMYPYAASIDDSRQKVGYDLFYIKNRTLFMYFMIILKTVRSVFLMKGR